MVVNTINCQAALKEDISPHLCFICLLHLANEHGLNIHGCPGLDDLGVHILSSCQKADTVAQASTWSRLLPSIEHIAG
ncbi:hypothetical protein SLEP1_g45929 [Rubroshorea leprosula]|uniref:Condensin complex subunit 2 n=1 Tax=Rubroshorea leprosula TaxID=152421 RepID=A0AAV5LKL3_9ROSI|nr:hypothetical protein SLEP1_g45929 [Rubroshorea leprosula]